MPRPRGSGLNVVRKKRKDGTVVEYFYERATKRFLGHDRDAAAQRLVPVDRDLEAGIVPGSITALIVDYLRSDSYRRLAPATRTLYRNYLARMRSDWGDIAARSITRAEVKRLREGLSATPRKANQILSLFQILFGRAKEAGQLGENVFERFGRFPIASRIEIWDYAMEDAFLARARPALQLAYMLLLYTVQRPSDVLDMRVGRISERDGRLFIALRQAKTQTLLDVPVHARLDPLLRARLAQADQQQADEAIVAGRIGPAPDPLLVPSPRGLLWARRNFSRAWDHVLRRLALAHARTLFRAGMSRLQVEEELQRLHRQRRDLRRTGIVRLAEAEATTPQIAAISGHSIDYCQRIIDTYLPRRTEVALGGIERWERHQSRTTSKIVTIATARSKTR